jgi:DNA end-binding protein Ku
MARRAIWKGVISFGNTRVPVKLYSAVVSNRPHFHMIHDQDQVRLRQQMVCAAEGKPVSDDEIVKGLEVDDNEYVLVEQEDLEQLEPESDRTIEVEGFADPDEVDPRFFDRAYHLGPDSEAGKYAALAKALDARGKLGICHWTFRKRFYNGVLRASQGVLEMVTLRTGDEVGDVDELELPEAGLSDKERKTATYLVEELTEEFDPSQYRNDFQEELMDLVETKAKGGKIKKRKPKAPEPTESDDLVGALEASLNQARSGRKSKGESGKKSSGKGKGKSK